MMLRRRLLLRRTPPVRTPHNSLCNRMDNYYFICTCVPFLNNTYTTISRSLAQTSAGGSCLSTAGTRCPEAPKTKLVGVTQKGKDIGRVVSFLIRAYAHKMSLQTRRFRSRTFSVTSDDVEVHDTWKERRRDDNQLGGNYL